MEIPQTGPVPTGSSATAELDRLRRDLAGEALRADLGELARPLTHEFNNFLNNLVLNLAILEQAGGDAGNSGLARLRRQADQVTGLIKQFHDFRGRQAPPAEPVDVNAALREAAQVLARDFPNLFEERPAAQLLALNLAAELRPLSGQPLDFTRLGVFLLKNGVQAARAVRTTLRVETAASATAAVVRLDLPGVVLPTETPGRLFESLGNSVAGLVGLELAACTALARRFRGKLTAETRAEGGLRLVLEVPFPA